MFRKLFIICFFLFIVSAAHSQEFPVKATLLLHPPYSSYLSDYSNPDARMSLILTMMDYSLSSYQVKLKFTLKGSQIQIKSKSYYFSSAITLTPGLPLLIEGEDFSDLLNYDNLDFLGITRSAYENSMMLPEGEYEFSVEVYDFSSPTPVEVSQEATAEVWILQYEPPLLNTPVENSVVDYSPVNSVLFSWTPRHLGVISADTRVEYQFEIWQRIPQGLDINLLMADFPPLHRFSLSSTEFVYDNQFPPLLRGSEYIWRIKAVVLEGKNLFKNNGYSLAGTFGYGTLFSGLNLNLNLRAIVLNHRQARLIWDSLNLCESYQIQFRKKSGDLPWLSSSSLYSSLLLNNLDAETKYEARIRAGLPMGNFVDWSSVIEFTTLSPVQFSCDDSPVIIPTSLFKPLKMGNEGMRIRVGLFDMKVSQLSNFQSDQGVYSGKGIINMPFSFQLACEFKEIRIDENQNLVSGKVNASTEGISNWIQDWLSDGGGGNTFFYSGSIDSVQVGVNGECIIYGSNGSMVITPDQYPFVITDSNSNSYLVNANGNLQLDNSFASMVIPDSVRKIYKLAILELKNEFSQNKINQLLNQKEQINSNFINGLEQKFSVQIQEDVENENVFLYPIQSQNSEWNGHENFNNSELAYITGLVIKIFSNRTLRETDYQLLAQGFEIKGSKSIDYIQSGISSGILDEVLVSETKQALKEFIRKVVEQKLED